MTIAGPGNKLWRGFGTSMKERPLAEGERGIEFMAEDWLGMRPHDERSGTAIIKRQRARHLLLGRPSGRLRTDASNAGGEPGPEF